MRFRIALTFTASLIGLSLNLPAQLLAAEAPPPLRNRTITMSWSTSGSGRSDAGQQKSFTNINTRRVYISTVGRPFLRVQLTSTKKSGTSRGLDVGPGERSGRGGVRFEGNRLIGTEVFSSGARQYIATFDSSFVSCTLNVLDARSGGEAIRRRGPDGAMYTLGPVTTGSPSCSIQSGNAFAGQ